MCKLVLQYKVVLPTLRAGQKNSCTFRNMEVYGDLHARKKKGRGQKVKGKLQKQNPTGRGQASKKAEREVYTFLEGLIKVDSGKR